MRAVKEKTKQRVVETYNFRITNQSNEANLLIAYLAALPYVEMSETFEEEEPNDETLAALNEIKAGKGHKTKDLEDLIAQLEA
jgi:mannitol-1-phosphate/altronate dehydrogenase